MTAGTVASSDRAFWASSVWSRLRSLPASAAILLIAGFLVFPTLLVVVMSLADEAYIHFPPHQLSGRWYIEYFNDPRWMTATMLSLRVAFGTMIASTLIGTMASLAFVRGRLPGGETIRVLSLGPLIAPSIVTAVAIYLAFSRAGLTGSYVGFVTAHTILAVPYVILIMTASLSSFDTDVELAAMNCGASRLRAFFEVVLPNVLPGLMSAAIFAFLTSFDEATVSIFISAANQQTLTSKLFEDINDTLTPVIPAVSTIMVVLSLSLMGLIAGGRHLLRRSSGVQEIRA